MICSIFYYIIPAYTNTGILFVFYATENTCIWIKTKYPIVNKLYIYIYVTNRSIPDLLIIYFKLRSTELQRINKTYTKQNMSKAFFNEAKKLANSHTFQTFDNHTLTYYTVKGFENNNGANCILLHGFTSESVGGWFGPNDLAIALARNNYIVYALDLRGHGHSARLTDPKEYENDALAKDIPALATHLKLKKYNLIGYSMGSIVAAKVLILDPKRIISGIFGGTGAAFTDRAWLDRYGIGIIAVTFEKRANGEIVDLSNTDHPQWGGGPAPNKNVAQFMLQMAGVQRSQPVTTKEELNTIQQPIMIINGNKDFDNGDKEELLNMLNNATLVTINGDHISARADPQYIKKTIEFLKEFN